MTSQPRALVAALDAIHRLGSAHDLAQVLRAVEHRCRVMAADYGHTLRLWPLGLFERLQPDEILRDVADRLEDLAGELDMAHGMMRPHDWQADVKAQQMTEAR